MEEVELGADLIACIQNAVLAKIDTEFMRGCDFRLQEQVRFISRTVRSVLPEHILHVGNTITLRIKAVELNAIPRCHTDAETRRNAIAINADVFRRQDIGGLGRAVETIAIVTESTDQLEPLLIIALPLNNTAISLLFTVAEVVGVGFSAHLIIINAIGKRMAHGRRFKARAVIGAETGCRNVVITRLADTGLWPNLILIIVGVAVIGINRQVPKRIIVRLIGVVAGIGADDRFGIITRQCAGC